VTGLAAKEAAYIYLSSRTQNTAYRYNAPGLTSRYAHNYYLGASQTRDIAITPEENIWVATDWTSMPMRLYDPDNQMIDFIDNTLLPGARGVTLDDEGYLWVSDIGGDIIYKIDLTEGMEGSGETPIQHLEASANPFSGQVTITGNGFDGQAVLGIYDVSGSLVAEDGFGGSFTFGDSEDVHRGIYFARVTSGSGEVSVLKLTAL
jgi:hypothetical protein